MNWLYLLFYIAYFFTIISSIVVIVSENRNPVKSISWIVVLFFLPIIGLLFYLVFGQSFTKQRLISRRRLQVIERNAICGNACVGEEFDESVSRQLMELINSSARASLYVSNDVQIFREGREKFAALIADIQNAKVFVHLQYYIFADDELGDSIFKLLQQKVEQGVEVRVIYDDVGSWSTPRRFFDKMRAIGIDAQPFQKVAFRRLTNKINYRNHRKVVVIDGMVGYIGGMNIADRYVKGNALGEWRDTHLRIEGSAVHGLEIAFAIDWHYITRQVISHQRYYPLVASSGNIPIQIVTSGPIGQWNAITLALFKAISGAHESVYIQTPYFLPTDYILKALQVAALSKIDVRVMLPEHCDSKLLQWGSHSYLSPLLKAGVKVYFYQNGFLHSKSVVIDSEVASVGSTNFDFRSFEQNFEINAFIYDTQVCEELKRCFISDQKKCRRLNPTAWGNRSWRVKVSESIVRLMSPLL